LADVIRFCDLRTDQLQEICSSFDRVCKFYDFYGLFADELELKDAMKRDPVKNHAVGREEDLVTDVLAQSGVVLIAWEQKAIAREILRLLAKGQELPNMATKWDGTRFELCCAWIDPRLILHGHPVNFFPASSPAIQLLRMP
jgi:hypothetical protein